MDESNLQEMIDVVKDAGLYEDNMLDEDIKTYYKAIADSKDMSTAEIKSRSFESDEDMFTEPPPNTSSPAKDVTGTLDNNSNEAFEDLHERRPNPLSADKSKIEDDIENFSTEARSEEADINQDATKAKISFNDMPKSKETPLDIIYYPTKFINIQNSKNFLSASMNIKALMLYSYHTKMEKLRSQLARQSFFTASMPKPILLKDIYTPSLEMDNNFEETYVSRSGRQTKRKLYTYFDEDSMESASNKKRQTKNNEAVWQSKSKVVNKTCPKRSEPKSKLDFTQKVESTQKAEGDQNVESEKEAKAMEVEINKVVQKETPKPRAKKLSNAEIMNKSSLFADSPSSRRRSTKCEKMFDALTDDLQKQKEKKAMKVLEKSLEDATENRSTRCEKMFDILKDDVQKKQKEEKVIEAFQKTLEDVIDSSQKSEQMITVVEEEPAKRRVIPPLPTRRKPIHNRAKQQKRSCPSPLNVNVVRASSSTQKDDSDSSDDIFESATSLKKKQTSKRPSAKENSVATSSTTGATVNTADVECPLCSKLFPEKIIEEHASSCGEEHMVTRNTPKSKILCEICERVITENYDSHVRACKRLHEESDIKRK